MKGDAGGGLLPAALTGPIKTSSCNGYHAAHFSGVRERGDFAWCTLMHRV